ncbi:Hypothetical protein, putative [Bodo saltans]|uniref:Uncharacterized protein n=1 Tax=Bodo saltans TaxID=75058 RepID=A0A0S4IW95_BODSA|nr:Hypothetical protein, putative [Bodo saltans]|eukprot:CUF97029.1 Hypothetical protein, putative [Bodo saltans]
MGCCASSDDDPQSNGMKVLMNHKGKRAKYAAARMYDGIDHLVTDFCKKVAAVEPRTPLQLVYRPGENHVEMDERGVGMFCFAEHGTMFLVIIDPHDGVKPPAGVTYERKLNLIAGAGEDTMIAFSVYSVPASSSSDLVVTFVVDALKKHLLSETDSFSAHGLLTSHHFRAAHRIPMPFDQQICIAASSRDFEYLSERFVDFRGKSPVLTSAFLVDRKDMAWSQNPGGVVLIGGESGSGKTWAMITNYFQMTDLTVYIRPTEVFATFDNEWGNDDVDKEERNKAFCSLLAAAVRVAIDRVCKPLNEKLKKLSDPQGFAVRVCLDEIGGNPIVTRACCANDSNKNLRNELGWADGVEIRLFGAGTGVGSVSNPGGSENKYYQLAMLDAPRGIGMYWEYRLNLWNSMTSGAAQNDPRLQPIVNLKESVKYLHGKWSGSPEERAEALRKRDEMLWEAFAKDTRVSKEKESKPINTNYATLGREDLVAEAIFSAIESDGTCVAVLHNPRLAALMVAQCKLEARRTCQDEVCAKTSGTNIRRRILLPVASKFRQKNGLQEVTADEAFQLLVESLRYTIFDGYKSANPDDVDYSANRLATRRGVLVDNTIFVEAAKFNEKEYVKVTLDDGHNALPQPEAAASPSQSVQTGQTSTPTYIACYRKDTGRYSISAAMVVVLSNLMSNAFEENFSNIGDVFERAVAKFLFITTQVFHGRPVHELLSFIIGPFAIVGARVLAAVGAKVVAFQSLVLRIGAKLNVGALPKQNVPAAAAAPTSAAQPTGEGDESGEGALYATKRAKAKAQFAKLWKSESRTCAWIEVSPSSLPSADIVLHIPGVITLAFQCKDTAPYLPKEIQKALLIMNPHESTELLPQKLHDLGAPVVPILYMTRAVHNLFFYAI